MQWGPNAESLAQHQDCFSISSFSYLFHYLSPLLISSSSFSSSHSHSKTVTDIIVLRQRKCGMPILAELLIMIWVISVLHLGAHALPQAPVSPLLALLIPSHWECSPLPHCSPPNSWNRISCISSKFLSSLPCHQFLWLSWERACVSRCLSQNEVSRDKEWDDQHTGWCTCSLCSGHVIHAHASQDCTYFFCGAWNTVVLKLVAIYSYAFPVIICFVILILMIAK